MTNNIIRVLVQAFFLTMTVSTVANAAFDRGDFREMKQVFKSELRDLYREAKTASPEETLPAEFDPISDFETELPLASQQRISKFESFILSAYLDSPNDAGLAQLLAVYNVFRTPRGNYSSIRNKRKAVRAIKRSVYSLYFLRRAAHLGVESAWVENAISRAEAKLDALIPTDLPVEDTEGTPAQTFFLESFNFNEADRFEAVDKLLTELLDFPTKLTTNAYIIAGTIWNAGEAEFSDPTILYNMAMSSYFAERVIPLYQRSEQAWLDDPENNQLYRLATLLGGWTVPARRWLALLHGDQDIVALLDAEHREWNAINPFFHSASIGWMLFDEPQNLLEGFQTAFAVFGCTENRACADRPRFSFNILSYTLLIVDYFLRLGDTDTASFFLTFRFNPFFEYDSWLLGQEAWEHRENNMAEIVARYQNADPSDDPTTASLKSHEWGPNTITCQLCHQVQAREWTDEEFATVLRPTDEQGFIGEWPTRLVDWVGILVE